MGVKVFWRWPNLTTLGEWPMNQHKLEYQFNEVEVGLHYAELFGG